jgi:hypothetical protein
MHEQYMQRVQRGDVGAVSQYLQEREGLDAESAHAVAETARNMRDTGRPGSQGIGEDLLGFIWETFVPVVESAREKRLDLLRQHGPALRHAGFQFDANLREDWRNMSEMQEFIALTQPRFLGGSFRKESVYPDWITKPTQTDNPPVENQNIPAAGPRSGVALPSSRDTLDGSPQEKVVEIHNHGTMYLTGRSLRPKRVRRRQGM